MGVIFPFFVILPFYAKISPAKNKTQETLLRKFMKYRENYPHMKGLAKIFAKFSPSENNQVYSIWISFHHTACLPQQLLAEVMTFVNGKSAFQAMIDQMA